MKKSANAAAAEHKSPHMPWTRRQSETTLVTSRSVLFISGGTCPGNRYQREPVGPPRLPEPGGWCHFHSFPCSGSSAKVRPKVRFSPAKPAGSLLSVINWRGRVSASAGAEPPSPLAQAGAALLGRGEERRGGRQGGASDLKRRMWGREGKTQGRRSLYAARWESCKAGREVEREVSGGKPSWVIPHGWRRRNPEQEVSSGSERKRLFPTSSFPINFCCISVTVSHRVTFQNFGALNCDFKVCYV